MATGPVYLTSDVHLGAIPERRARDFLRWLAHAGARASEIVVNGDLFDFWFEYGSVVPRGHTRVLGALARIVDAGIRVDLMGGNHDWWGGSFLTDEVGVSFHRDPVILELAGLRVLLAHGDGLGPGDVGYQLLRFVLRGRLTRWAFRWLHPDLGAAAARWVSHTEERGDGPTRLERDRAETLRTWAHRTLEEDPSLECVVLGHTHIPALDELEGGRFYVNTGDWIYHRSYAVLAPDESPRVERWEG